MLDYFNNRLIQNFINLSSVFVFDLNGLIIDDESLQLHAVNLSLKNKGLNIKIDEEYWIIKCVGNRADKYFKEILKENNLELKEEIINELVNIKNAFYKDLLKENLKKIIRDGILDFLEYLKTNKSGKKHIVLATSALKDETDSIIGDGGLKIKKYFDLILTGSDITKSKPDPEIYNLITKLLNIAPSKGVVFEDSLSGVYAAKTAGYKVIAVPNRFTINQDLSLADITISGFKKDATILK